jgi:hypothetical protein
MTSRYARNFALLLVMFLLNFVWCNLHDQRQARINAEREAEYNEQSAAGFQRGLPAAITAKPEPARR